MSNPPNIFGNWNDGQIWAECLLRSIGCVRALIETFTIDDPPDAEDMFGHDAYRRLFAHASGMLRPLSPEETGRLMDLEIRPLETANAWVGIEDEAQMAEMSEIDERTRRNIDHDLTVSGAIEGLTDEQRQQIRLRAAWLADRFIRNRRDAGTIICDDCGFDHVLASQARRSSLDHCSMFITGIPSPKGIAIRLSSISNCYARLATGLSTR